MSGSMASIREASGLASPAGSSSAWLGLGLGFGLGLHGQGRGMRAASEAARSSSRGGGWQPSGAVSPLGAPSQPELSGAP